MGPEFKAVLFKTQAYVVAKAKDNDVLDKRDNSREAEKWLVNFENDSVDARWLNKRRGTKEWSWWPPILQ